MVINVEAKGKNHTTAKTVTMNKMTIEVVFIMISLYRP